MGSDSQPPPAGEAIVYHGIGTCPVPVTASSCHSQSVASTPIPPTAQLDRNVKVPPPP